MASRFLALVAIQAILLQTVYTQCVNRVLPGCGPNLVETLLPNQVLYREPALPILPGPVCPGPILPAPIYQSPIIPEIGCAPTIIHDSSVANSLANALQLLVVSNLLSTTLPGACDYPIYPYEVVPTTYPYVY